MSAAAALNTALHAAGAPHQWVLGVPIAPLTMEETLALAAERIVRRERLLIGVVNAAKVVNMQNDARLREAVLTADLILADGMPVVWASRLAGSALPERVAGIDLMTRLLECADERGWRVFFLGAEQRVLDQVLERVREQYPGLQIAGSRNGYFRLADEAHIAAQIRDARADVLLVAMSSPKKEEFLARFSSVCGVPVCHGVGGAFDVLAGKVQRAPASWQRLGLEWLYRVLQEPRRLWWRYAKTNTVFVAMLTAELARRAFSRRSREAERAECTFASWR